MSDELNNEEVAEEEEAVEEVVEEAAPTGAGKSKIAAGILAILIGTLGIHNFYLGFTGKGVAQLLISVLSLGMLAWVSWIWALIEGVMILTDKINTDAAGNPLV